MCSVVFCGFSSQLVLTLVTIEMPETALVSFSYGSLVLTLVTLQKPRIASMSYGHVATVLSLFSNFLHDKLKDCPLCPVAMWHQLSPCSPTCNMTKARIAHEKASIAHENRQDCPCVLCPCDLSSHLSWPSRHPADRRGAEAAQVLNIQQDLRLT